VRCSCSPIFWRFAAHRACANALGDGGGDDDSVSLSALLREFDLAGDSPSCDLEGVFFGSAFSVGGLVPIFLRRGGASFISSFCLVPKQKERERERERERVRSPRNGYQ